MIIMMREKEWSGEKGYEIMITIIEVSDGDGWFGLGYIPIYYSQVLAAVPLVMVHELPAPGPLVRARGLHWR